ncbi:hypothetical protein A3C96_00900 [Candidatus Uhrbacteria bacterium RIFCSPHIGHO2_02_FULL_60_10]|uniref:Glycosyltransferase 2-like domain-containing protein n=1 Tax=Candidatus Uhrbacteria bacterium RIFCSPHIGHO2_02_FULL_60_10 TaxID=1802392 RepID=A0A1F7U6K2_9BACT|nr:MAG: hypothetical protein A3C96_00900 [Candidatus Uhrbacteria bacterium RIFCSPHIGHO2_02_FULL_60_10]
MPRVAVIMPVRDDMKFLPEALASLEAQTHQDLTVLIVDNGSSDGLEAYLHGHFPRVAILRHTRDLGLVRALNQGLAYAESRLQPESSNLFVLTMSPRLVLAPTCVERLLAALISVPTAGAAAAKILKAGVKGEGEFVEHVPTDLLDSVGLEIGRFGWPGRRQTGQVDKPETGWHNEEGFGAVGELALYRFAALQTVRGHDGWFDESLGSALTDADLAWRLRIRGWAALAVPAARAWRRSGAVVVSRWPRFQIWREWRRQPSRQRVLLRRNRWLLLAKNDHPLNFFRRLPVLAVRGLLGLVAVTLTEPDSLGYLPAAFSSLPRFLWRRREVFAQAVPARELWRWFRN